MAFGLSLVFLSEKEMNMDSILTSVKKMLGITEEYTSFDADIIMHINSVFMILNQLGVGPETPYVIVDKTNTWDEFLNGERLELVRSYMFLKVKMLFDPPVGTVNESYNRQIAEFEWRLNIAADSNNTD